MIRMGPPTGGIERGSLPAAGGAVNPAPEPCSEPYTGSNAPRRFAPAAFRGTARSLGLGAEPRGPPAHRGKPRRGLGRGRDLETVAPLVGALLLVAEGRAGTNPLRHVPVERARPHLRARLRPAGARPRP